MSGAEALSYADVTERPGQPASAIQMEMLEARYAWAAAQARGRDVLEVACGAGIGLPLLAGAARSVKAGDVDPENLRAARKACAGCANVTVEHLCAPELGFPDRRFDLVLLFEALYYIPEAERFFEEARRVLRPGGALLIVTVNREWTGFNPSPLSIRYWSAEELLQGLEGAGFDGAVQGAFPEIPGWSRSARGLMRRGAVALGLIPRTMRGKALLKRMFYGPLQTVPSRICLAQAAALEPWNSANRSRCRVLYATARKGAT